jgi:hypothetical protein
VTRFRCRRIAELAIGSRQDENAIGATGCAELAPVITLRDNLIGTTHTTGYLKSQGIALRNQTNASAIGIEVAIEVVAGHLAMQLLSIPY